MIFGFGAIAMAAQASVLMVPAVANDGAASPLARNEVLLEVASIGVAHNRADKVTVQVPLSATAATAGEARRLVAAQADHLSAVARAAGVAAEDIRLEREQRAGFVGNEAYSLEALRRPEKLTATASLELRIRDPNRFSAIREALEGAGAQNVPDTDFALSDDRIAREQAKADALQKGRGEAEAYAHSLGMHVVRIVRVSERVAPELSSPEMMRDMMKMMSGASSSDQDVETMASVAMDFVLAPDR
jgi:uncharacterized protein YggE